MNFNHTPLSFVTQVIPLDCLDFPLSQIKQRGYEQTSASINYLQPGNYFIAASAGGYTFPVKGEWFDTYKSWLHINLKELRTAAVVRVTKEGVTAKKVGDGLE